MSESKQPVGFWVLSLLIVVAAAIFFVVRLGGRSEPIPIDPLSSTGEPESSEPVSQNPDEDPAPTPNEPTPADPEPGSQVPAHVKRVGLAVPTVAAETTGGNSWEERTVVARKGENLAAVLRGLGAVPQATTALISAAN